MADDENLAHWGTIADALTRTGLTVTNDELAQASSVIETVTGAVFAFTSTLVNKLDRYWLDAATAYMVPFLRDHPDYLTRLDASEVGQDGQSVTLKADALVLPPMAKRCTKRLSWRGTRTLLPVSMRQANRVGSPVLAAGEGVRDYVGEHWTPES